MDISSKHPKLLLQEFDNKIDQMKEESRVMKARSDLCFKKIKEAEEVIVINRLKEDNNKFDYEKAESEVKRLLAIKEHTELPYTNLLHSIIHIHSGNISQGMTPDTRLSSGKELFQYHETILHTLKLRINNLKLEIIDINTALNNGLPLKYLAKLNQEEITEHALDRKLEDMNSDIEKRIHIVQNEVLGIIVSLENDLKKFEQKHSLIKTTAEKTEYIRGILPKITAYVSVVSDALVILIDFLPFSSVMKGILDIFYKASSSANLTVELIDRTKKLNEEMIKGLNVLEDNAST